MSEYSVEYFNGQFKKCYEDALYAKERGNTALAAQKFSEAAAFLEKAAVFAKEDKEQMKERAERLKKIAASMQAAAPAKPAPVRGQASWRASEAATAGGAEATGDFNADDEEMSQFITFFAADKLLFGFEGVIGLDDAKKAVTDYVINPMLYPDFYNYDFIDNKGVLLEGPPGTGKTTFAKAVAKEIKQPFALVDVAKLVNCYVGETAKNIDKVFAYLRSFAESQGCGVTVFFDEFDEIAKKRGGDDKASAAAVPALLRNLDGMARNKNFLIIANTNHKEMLDKAVLDRFRKLIYIPLPDQTARKALFAAKLREIEPQFAEKLDPDALASAAEGLSGRDITYIADDFKHYLGDVKRENAADTADVQAQLLTLIADRLAQKA